MFKKYQIEVIQPNLEYIVNKFQTAYEEYQKEHRTIEEKSKSNQLINFKHTKYDQKPNTGK